jgi:hypothetical protein
MLKIEFCSNSLYVRIPVLPVEFHNYFYLNAYLGSWSTLTGTFTTEYSGTNWPSFSRNL